MGGSAEVVDLTVPLSEVENPLRVREGCPEVQVEPFSGQQWAIVSLNLLDPEMIIQNVSGRSLELTTDQQWCSFPKYERLIPLDVADPGNIQRTEFAPGEILRVKLVESDRVEGERVDPIRFDPSGGEMGLYRGSGTYRNIEDIFAFISWRDGNPTEGREMVASGAGIWALGERVEIEPGWGGIIAVGDPRVATGFRSVPLACLPLRDGQEE